MNFNPNDRGQNPAHQGKTTLVGWFQADGVATPKLAKKSVGVSTGLGVVLALAEPPLDPEPARPSTGVASLESPTGADGGAVEGAAATGLPASALALSLHSASTDDDRDDTREGGLELPLGTGLASSQLSLHSSVAVAVAAGAAGAGALPRVLGASGVEEPPRDS